MKIHPLAFVDDTAEIGEGTSVWQFASVIRGAKIGRNCNIATGACIDGSVVGDNTKIAHNLAMGPGFVVGSGCFIGPNVTFCNDAWPRAHTEGFNIGLYDGKPAVIMEDGSTIGANAVILPGVHIGKGAMIAAGAVVTKNVPEGMIWMANGDLRDIGREEARLWNRVRHAQDPVEVSRAFMAQHGFVL